MDPILPIPQASSLRRYLVLILITVAIFLFGFLFFISEPPSDFPTGTLVTVHSGDSLSTIVKDFKAKHLIRSAIILRTIVTLSASEQKIVAGDYYFGKPISVFSVVSRLLNGNFDLVAVRMTIPEGTSMKQIASLLAPKLSHFSTADFLASTTAKEGYLFPDTYFFAPGIDSAGVIDEMQKNFAEKIKSIEPVIAASGKSEKDIITMASILEEEARTPEDWRIISGILWKRIKIGMALQVDSTVGYYTGKPSSELSAADLKIDSPYNTYTRRGLPPTPIANPGLETITAAATPTTTPYLYYLSDKNGVIHYAATFADHIKNQQKYLK